MKLRKLFILVLALAMILINCISVYADDEQIPEEMFGKWAVDEIVDEFGDPTGESTLYCIVRGDFSNTATLNSDLAVVVFYDVFQGFSFRLLEYYKSKATYLSNSELSLKTKIDEEISEYKLYGSSPNGDLHLTYLENSNVPNMDSIEDIAEWYNTASKSIEDYHSFFNTFSEEDEIRCIIYIDNSKYNFTLPTNGFSELAVPLVYENANALYENGYYEEALELFQVVGNYEDSSEKAIECNRKLLGPSLTVLLNPTTMGYVENEMDYIDYYKSHFAPLTSEELYAFLDDNKTCVYISSFQPSGEDAPGWQLKKYSLNEEQTIGTYYLYKTDTTGPSAHIAKPTIGTYERIFRDSGATSKIELDNDVFYGFIGDVKHSIHQIIPVSDNLYILTNDYGGGDTSIRLLITLPENLEGSTDFNSIIEYINENVMPDFS